MGKKGEGVVPFPMEVKDGGCSKRTMHRNWRCQQGELTISFSGGMFAELQQLIRPVLVHQEGALCEKESLGQLDIWWCLGSQVKRDC